MSFIANAIKGAGYHPGWFLAVDETCERLTHQMEQAKAETAENGGKYIPMGTVWPANDATAEGIVYEDVDVSSGDMPGSVVTRGTVYLDRLPVEMDEEAKTALAAKGFVFIDEAPAVTRPY